MAKPQLLLLALVALAVLCASAPVSKVDSNKPALKFRADGTFKIVQFTDLHFGDSDEADAHTQKIQTAIIQAEKPDLVVLTGDAIQGYSLNKTESGWFLHRWRRMVEPMINQMQYYAYVLGNHDDQADYGRREIALLDMTCPYSLTQQGELLLHGNNYYLQVLDENGQNPAATLYMFDSGDMECLDVKGYDCIRPNQVEWYRNTATTLKTKYGKTLPALAFFHIPLHEYMNVWNFFNTTGIQQDSICCQALNGGLFMAFKEQGDVKATTCGHDHANDFCGDYYGIKLCYGRKTGVGCYGPPEGIQRGARVFEIKYSPSFSMKTWIRQEDGSVADQPFHAPGTDLVAHCCEADG